MTKQELQNLLSKLTLQELRSLAKKLDINLKRKGDKPTAVSAITDGAEMNDIFEKLGISSNISPGTEDEAVKLAKEALKKQDEEIEIGKKSNRIGRRNNLIGLVAVLVALGAFFWPSTTSETENEEPTTPATETVKASLFKSPDNYNILLLPFGSSENCDDKTVICEREVESRFNLLKEEDASLDFEVQLYKGVNTKERSVSFDKARTVGDSLGADLVIWGDYQNKCEWDSTKIRVKWASVKDEVPFANPKKGKDYQTVESITKIEEGEITGDVEEIVYWGLGQQAMSEKKFEKALHFFEQITLQEKKEYSIVCFYMGVCAYNFPGKLEPNFRRSIIHYDRAIELDPDDATAFNNRGDAYNDLKEYRRAIRDYDRAILLDPGFVTAFNNRGVAYNDLKEYRRAIEDYDRVIQLNPDYVTTFYNRGYAYHDLKEYHRAIRDYDRAIELDPNDAMAFYNRGDVYHDLKEYRQAIRDYDRAILLDPDDALAFYNRGHAYGELKQYRRAIRDYDRAILLDPDDALAFYNRGYAYGELKQYRRAIRDYDRAIELDPYDAMAFNNRGNNYRRLGEIANAKNDIQKSMSLDDDNGWAYATLAMIYADEGNNEEFYRNMEIAISKPLTYPLNEKLEEEETLRKFKEEARFKKLLAQSKK